MSKKTQITVEVLVDADDQRAWDGFVNPAAITRWNFASPEWCCPTAENDVRVGGQLRSRMEARDGSMGFDFAATYVEVVALQKLVFVLGDERVITVLFRNEDGRTRVTETFDAENTYPLEHQRGGWQAILDNYKTYVESNA